MSRHLRRADRRLIFVAGDTISAAAAVVLALWTWSLTAGFPFNLAFLSTHAEWFLSVPLWVIALAPSRRASAAFHPGAAARGLLHAAGVLLMTYLAAYFSAGADRLPRLVALYLLWDAAWLTLASRTILIWLFTRHSRVRRVAIVGEGLAADAARQLLREPAYADAALLAPPSLDLPTDLTALAEIIVAAPAGLTDATVEQLLACQARGIEVNTLVHLHEALLRRVPVRFVGSEWITAQLFSGAEHRETSSIAKRSLDLAGASALAILGLIPGVVAAIAVAIESGWPVFYSQIRTGRGGRPFTLVKLRSMRHDAEADGPQWSRKGDPRITRVGRVLRRTHLDELPNLWAVFRGDMSLVGPRPERPEFVALLERELPLYRSRLTVVPGLTGWAQVKTTYGDSVEDAARKLEYDLYYVRHRSLWFDIAILARTVGRTLGWKGR